jgi:hypothetical protein
MELGTEYQFALTRKATSAGGIDSLEPIPRLHKRLKIRAGYIGCRINSLESIPGLIKRLKIRAVFFIL